MRIGIIDLGTNSVRFAVHTIGPGKKSSLLHREKIMIRLGQGVFVRGRLDRDAIGRTTHAFHRFKHIATDLSVTKIIALGTSALREAVDGAKLVNHLRSKVGIDVRVITGKEEARLIALGILTNEKNAKKGRVGLIDIGGGSTEISVIQRRKVVRSDSFQLGTARLQQVFLGTSPPTARSIEELRLYIRRALAAEIIADQWPRVRTVLGSSGTIRALGRIFRKRRGKKSFDLGDLQALILRMSRMTTTQLLGIEGMDTKRVDMILAGAILLEESMKMLGADQILPTEFSLRDGILQEQMELARQHSNSQIALHIPDLIEKAKRFGSSEQQLQAATENAALLFKKLQPLHKLPMVCCLYLKAAAILRNCGEAVSVVGHAEHSYYIVKNAKFAFVEAWEAELVGQLCRHHQTQRLDFESLPFQKERTKQQLFLKLLALLSVVDGLDGARLRRVASRKDYITLYFDRGTGSDIEIFRLDQRRELFKQILNKTIFAERK